MNTKFRKNSLEAAIIEFLAKFPEETKFDVIAHELTNDGHGWSVNDNFRIGTDCDKEEVAEHARGRWEIFKINYMPKARIYNLEDTGWEKEIHLECDYVSFLTIRVREEEKKKENSLHTEGGSFTGRCDCGSGEFANRCCYTP